MAMLPLILARLSIEDKQNGYWGTYTSLYPTLQPPEHIATLEEAILAGTLGHYDEAEAIFEQRLPPSHTLSVIALERSRVYEIQGLHLEKANLLRKALEWSEKDAGHERWLMRLLLYHAEAFVNGTLRNALEEARGVRSVLADLPLRDYTDIDVRFHSTTRRGLCH
jgi:hypothetical protein